MALTDKLSAIGDAIREKTGTKEKIPLSEMPRMISGITGGGSSVEQFVQFYGKDGKVLFKYTLSEFAERKVLPTPPTHLDGCTFQGWNYDIETIKAMNSHVNVAAIYRQDDVVIEEGSAEKPEKTYVDGTKLYLHIDIPLTITLYYRQSVKEGVMVLWGDGSTYVGTNVSSNIVVTHDYVPGDYVIHFDIAENCTLYLGGNSTSYSVMGSCTFNGTWIPRLSALVKAEIDLRNTYPYSSAFRCCLGLREVVFGCGRDYPMQTYLFDQCFLLENVTLCDSVSQIGDYSFRLCYRLREISIPSSISKILSYAFQDCRRLHSIVIPGNVKRLYSYVFSGCSALRSAIFENGVEYIDSAVFNSCSNLESVEIPNTVTTIGTSVFTACYALKTVVMPAKITSVPSNFFQNCYCLRSVLLPEGTISIGASAFSGCASLSFIALPKSVKSIGTSAFSGCESLQNAVFGQGLTTLGDTVFANCYPLEYIILPPGVTSVGTYAFQNCTNLKNIVLPDSVEGVTSIFASCQIQSDVFRGIFQNMAEGCTALRNGAFDGCGYLEEIVMPQEATTIGDNAFRNAGRLKKAVMPAMLNQIGATAFQNCRILEKADISPTTTTIGNNAFERCHGLKKVVFPASLKTLGTNVFNYCYGLEEAEFRGAALSIGSGLFNYNYGLKKLTFPNTVSSISFGASAFYCSSLERIEDLPRNVFFADSSTFSNCYGLEFADLSHSSGGGSNSMNNMFYYCYALGEVKLPQYASVLGSSMFQYCYALSEKVSISEFITSVNSNAFYDCRTLKAVEFLGSAVTIIGSNAFYNCYAMREIRFPYSITSMSNCMNGCYGMSSIYLYPMKPPTGTTQIGTFADGYTIYVPKGAMAAYETQWTSHKGHFAEFEYLVVDRKELRKTIGLNVDTITVKNVFHHTELDEGSTVVASYSYGGKNLKEISDFHVDVDTGAVSFSFARNEEMDYEVTELLNIYVAVDGTDITCDFTLFLRYADSEIISEYTVVQAGGYAFVETSDEMYQSTNQGKHSTFCLCRVDFTTSTGKLYLDCSGEGESNCDFGLVSNLDMPLVASITADTGVVLKKSFSGLGKYSMTLEYDIEDSDQHYIYIKYRKDGSVNTGADCLRFRVRFE